jgi:biopolymer transport protein ExbB
MFRDAGSAAQSVMVLLALCSVWNVAIWIEKALRLRAANRRADRFLARFRAAPSLEALASDEAADGGEACPMAAMCRAGVAELRDSQRAGAELAGEARDRLAQRIEAAQQVVHAEAAHALGRSMSVLATIGATAPFVGLFGTVYGIMTSFIGIAQTQTTNLAVVAPGIAEALLATAVGLFAAIPAVVLYNKFSRDIAGFLARLAAFRSEFTLALARQLDLGGR